MPKPTPPATPAQVSFLVLYGLPPEFQIKDVQGRLVGKMFHLTKENRSSFETQLKIALGAFLANHADASNAKLVFIHDAAAAEKAIQAASSKTHVIYYGHAIEAKKELAPDHRTRITVVQLARMLKGSKISHFDFLGCASVSIAADLAISTPGIQFGGLMNKRVDDFEVETRTLHVRKMTISKQEFFHFGVSAP